ncbi:MAG: hypothetical protein NT069_28455, partial [Planctomycetota bacterium]|nr:hypothetical protein [Planctomycetota bacterium]
NPTVLSEHRVAKRVRLGALGMPNVVQYDVTFTVPEGERHHYAQFEALTGYMPREFQSFWTFRPSTGELQPLDDGPGEQEFPVVFSNAQGTHVMGVYSPDQPSAGYEKAGYGRWRFEQEQVVKWNCVFRVRDPQGVPPGAYPYRLFVVVGTRDDVRRSLTALVAKPAGD